MRYSICLLGVIPVRSEPDDRTELVTQILFGELLETIDSKGQWLKIRNTHDGYQGWIDRRQVFGLADEEFHKIRQLPVSVSAELIYPLKCETNGAEFYIPLGSRLYSIKEGSFVVGSLRYSFSGRSNGFPYKSDHNTLMSNALRLLNVPYLWGGRTLAGIDCSGFVQLVFSLSGIQLPRDASQQVKAQGLSLSFISEARPGDVAFFDNAEGTVTHVGILDGEGQIIHASGQVRIDPVDHQGIFNPETRTYSHQFRIAKSFIGM